MAPTTTYIVHNSQAYGQPQPPASRVIYNSISKDKNHLIPHSNLTSHNNVVYRSFVNPDQSRHAVFQNHKNSPHFLNRDEHKPVVYRSHMNVSSSNNEVPNYRF